MSSSTKDRSQPLLKLPKNQTPALVTMHDGAEAQVYMFVAPGDKVTQVVEDTSPFLPMSFSTGTRLVARASIASLRIHVMHAPIEEELPGERQNVLVRMCCSKTIKGELRWVAPEGQRRTLDHLNNGASYFVVHDHEHVTYITKAHVASVEEV
jgi:hypothetical protein